MVDFRAFALPEAGLVLSAAFSFGAPVVKGG